MHLLGITRSMELAAIGRRTAETEHDVLALIAPDQEPPAPTPVVGAHRARRTTAPRPSSWPRPSRSGCGATSPTAPRAACASTPAWPPTRSPSCERELVAGPSQAEAHRRRLDALGHPDDASLAAAIRAGAFDDRFDELHAALWAAVVDKLEVSNPGYAAGRP